MILKECFSNLVIFNPDPLFDKFRINERGIELSLAARYLNSFKDIIEVGAVTPYYFQNMQHTIVDPYDGYERCIKEDAESYNLTNQNVLCISTIEHMGCSDYGNTDLDESKPIRFLEKLEKETSSFLLTWPLAARPILDEYIFSNHHLHNVVFLHRISQEYPVWRVANDITSLRKIEYNKPFSNANGLVIITKGL